MKKESVPHVKCPQCDGTGRAPIAPVLVQTLFLFRGHRGGWTARELAARGDGDRITPNGWSNRLSDLLKLGLLLRPREGKEWRYTLAR